MLRKICAHFFESQKFSISLSTALIVSINLLIKWPQNRQPKNLCWTGGCIELKVLVLNWELCLNAGFLVLSWGVLDFVLRGFRCWTEGFWVLKGCGPCVELKCWNKDVCVELRGVGMMCFVIKMNIFFQRRRTSSRRRLLATSKRPRISNWKLRLRKFWSWLGSRRFR